MGHLKIILTPSYEVNLEDSSDHQLDKTYNNVRNVWNVRQARSCLMDN